MRSPPAIDGTLLNTGQRRAAARWRRSFCRHKLLDLAGEGEVPAEAPGAIAIGEGGVERAAANPIARGKGAGQGRAANA